MDWQGSPEILDVLTVIHGQSWLVQQRLALSREGSGPAGPYLARLAEGCQRLTELVTPFAFALDTLPRTAEIDALLILLDYYAACVETHLHQVLPWSDAAFEQLAAVRSACGRLRHLLPPLRLAGP